VAVDTQVLGPAQRRPPGGTAVAAGPLLAGADDGADLAGTVHDAQGVAGALQDVDVARVVHRDGARVDERSLDRHRAVLRDALLPVAGQGGNDASLEVDPADPAVVEVGQVEVLAAGVEGQAVNAAEPGRRRGAAVAAEAHHAGAGEGADSAG